MEINQIKAVVFDCDGVMFDTADANRLFYNKVLAHFNRDPLTEKQFKNVHMFTVSAALSYLFPDKTNLDDVYAYMKGVGYFRFIKHMIIEPGFRKLLKKLAYSDYIRAIATNRMDTMPAVLEEHDLENQFDLVVTAADVKHPKPEPDQLLTIMDKFGLKPHEVLFIGDSEYDQMAALAAGVCFIAFKNRGLPADFHCDSMADVGKVININL